MLGVSCFTIACLHSSPVPAVYVVEQAGRLQGNQLGSHTSMSRCDKIKQMNFRTHTMGSVTEEQFISIRDYVTLFFHSAMYIM